MACGGPRRHSRGGVRGPAWNWRWSRCWVVPGALSGRVASGWAPLEACGGTLFGRAAFAVRRRWEGGCACEGRTRVLKRIGNRVRTPPAGFRASVHTNWERFGPIIRLARRHPGSHYGTAQFYRPGAVVAQAGPGQALKEARGGVLDGLGGPTRPARRPCAGPGCWVAWAMLWRPAVRYGVSWAARWACCCAGRRGGVVAVVVVARRICLVSFKESCAAVRCGGGRGGAVLKQQRAMTARAHADGAAVVGTAGGGERRGLRSGRVLVRTWGSRRAQDQDARAQPVLRWALWAAPPGRLR